MRDYFHPELCAAPKFRQINQLSRLLFFFRFMKSELDFFIRNQ